MKESPASPNKPKPAHKKKPTRAGLKEVRFIDEESPQDNLDPEDATSISVFSLAKLVGRLIIFGILIGIGFLIFWAWSPQDISQIPGLQENKKVAPNIPDLLERAQNGNFPLILSEQDINLYLNQKLNAVQTGPIGILSRFVGVYVKGYDGYGEITFVREIGGTYQTVSIYVRPSSQESLEGPMVVTEYEGPRFLGLIPIGGKIGNLPLPQGYLHFLLPGFESLAKTLEPELDLLLDAHRPLQIRPGELQIVPSKQGEL